MGTNAYEVADRLLAAPRTIYRWVEADRIHFTETAESTLLICLNSIPAAT